MKELRGLNDLKLFVLLAVEAVHLANLLCQFGYYFPVSEQKNLLVKDDSSLYRFQVNHHLSYDPLTQFNL